MSNYDAVLGDLMTARANGQSVDGGLAALEEMRRDGERLDWLLEHQPWLSEVTREKLDVWMKLGGGDAHNAAPRLLAIWKALENRLEYAEALVAISDGHASKRKGACTCALCIHLAALRAVLHS